MVLVTTIPTPVVAQNAKPYLRRVVDQLGTTTTTAVRSVLVKLTNVQTAVKTVINADV